MGEQLSSRNELRQLLGDFGKARLILKLITANAMHGIRRRLDVPVRVDVTVESTAGRAPVNQLDTADFYDPVPQARFETRGLGIQYDLPHQRECTPCSASIAALARASTRSLPGTPEWPFTHCQVRSWVAASASSCSHRSWFLTGLRAAVSQPRAFQAGNHSRIP